MYNKTLDPLLHNLKEDSEENNNVTNANPELVKLC
jgi:hypothetical protein